MLEIRLLGQFRLTLDDQPIELPSRPAQSLLAYLAITAGIAHRREKLAGLLWPDIPESDARRNLRRALWHIRKALGGQAPLRADDITVTFENGPGVWVDALCLAQKLSGERSSLEELIQAVSAYRGELLPGFYDEWIIVERERLQAAFESQNKLLLDSLIVAKRWEAVLEWGEFWIAQARAAEPAYRALMVAYAGQGDLAGAAHAYQRCIEALERDLGVQPSDETHLLYQQLSSSISSLPRRPVQQRPHRQADPDQSILETWGEPDIEAGAGGLAEQKAPGVPEEPPFKGLQFFDEPDAGLFFGREAITTRLLKRLGLSPDSNEKGDPLLVIVGASGSGKSSLVRAGLASGVRQLSNTRRIKSDSFAGEPGLEQPGWEIIILTPSAHPIEHVAATLTREAESMRVAAALMDDMLKDSRSLRLVLYRRPQPVFLVIDQLEEVFTLCREEAERQAFIDNLMAAAEGDRCKLVLTLRADFYAHCARFESLRLALIRSQEYIGPMSTSELRRAIEAPAQTRGYSFEIGLVDLILREAGSEPGLLPLLSHALLETWKRRQGRALTLSGYAEAGGVRGAIAHTAESVYRSLPEDEQRIARNIFLRLTELGEGIGAGGLPTPDTRRRVVTEELFLQAEDRNCISEVLNRLAEARLITIDEGSVEVAHEALIREWPALRAWLSEDREGLRLHRRLTDAALSWEALECEPGELYRGARLAQAMEWAAAHSGELNDFEREFLSASQLAVEREATEREAARQREMDAARRFAEAEQQRAEEQARSARRFSWLAAGLAVLLLVTMALASFTFQQRNQVEDQARLAGSRELAASAISSLAVDPERSILLALQSVRISDTQEAESALHQAVQGSRLIRVFKTQNQWAVRVVASPDGQRIAATSFDQQNQHVTQVWETNSGKLLLSLPGGLAADFWPDDRLLATALGDAITFWDARSGEALSTIRLEGAGAEVINGNFSPDWTLAALAFRDGRTGIFRLDTGQRLFLLGKSGDPPGKPIEFTPDGSRLVSVVDGTTRIWDTHTGQPVATLPSAEVGVLAAAISPRLDQAAVGLGSVVQIVDDRSGQMLLTLSGHTGFVQGIGFNHDSTRLATAGADGQAILWDSSTGQALLKLSGHNGALTGLAFIPGSDWLATSSVDGTVRLWDISPAGGGEGASSYDRYGYWFSGIAFSPDGKQLGISGGSTAGEIISADTGQTLVSLRGSARGYQGGVSFSPDGSRLALASGENEARIWDAASGKKLLTLHGHQAWIGSLAFSPDGRRLATLGFDGQARVWDAASGQSLYTIQAYTENLESSQVMGIAFSPDGKRLATAAGLTPNIWDAATGKELLALPAQNENVYSVSFSPDGERLAIGMALGEGASIWDLLTGKEVARLTGHHGSVQAVRFSADGRQVITGSVDGTIKIWDAATGQEQLTLTHQAAQITGLALSPDGTRLAASSSDGTARVYLLRIDDLVRFASGRLTRWFTPEECRSYLHAATCPERPQMNGAE